MACERNRILEFKEYLNSLGIEINIGKNKARGNKGFFRARNTDYRIDIAKSQTEDEVLGILVHEFLHYVHYNYDKTLKSLDFIFNEYQDDYEEDLINLTVDLIPKKSIAQLFEQKESLKKEIKKYSDNLKQRYSDFAPNKPYKTIEKEIKKYDFKYLLKYDKVKVLKGFSTKIYSIESLEQDSEVNSDILTYLKLKSAQRLTRRINSKISRLNRYYNSPTELLARSFEYFVTKNETMKTRSPKLYNYYCKIINSKKIPMISKMAELVLN